MKSDNINELAAALAKVQEIMPAAKMEAYNPFFGKKYADLGSIIETARKPLSANNLSVSQLVEGNDENIGVTTMLMHSSGQWLESTVSMAIGVEKGKSAAQVAGSIITYLRRYSLASILGIYADEDGDGNAPEQKQRTVKAQTQTAKPETTSGNSTLRLEPYKLNNMLDKKAKSYSDKEASQKQRNLFALLLDQVLQDDSKRHIVCKYLFGEGSSKLISGSYILAAIDWLDPQRDDGGAYTPSEDAEREINAVYNAAIAENQPALV